MCSPHGDGRPPMISPQPLRLRARPSARPARCSPPSHPAPPALDDASRRFLAQPRDQGHTLSPPAGPAAQQALSSAAGSAASPTPPSRITAQIEQVSDEFHDEDHVRPNIGQAVRGSGRLPGSTRPSSPIGCLRLVRSPSAASFTSPPAASPGQFGLRNKMPYFFTVLRDLLGLQDA